MQPVLCLMGPTAAGKTALAVALARRHPLDIISVDSTQVYREMDIGSAKPDAETLALAPHRLIDIRDPADPYSAALFVEDARRHIDEIQRAGRIPFLVGGTMLYFRALLRGLSPLPEADPDIRRQLEREAGERGWEALHGDLAAIDPVAAARIHPNDPQRLQRALEVYRITGEPLSALQARGRPGLETERTVLKIALIPEDRALLHQRIEQRFRQMVDEGLVEEVGRLMARGDLDERLPAIRAVGYRQVWRYLRGDYDRAEMVERAVIATRQLAKRQLTWLRGETGTLRLAPDRLSLDEQIRRIEQKILNIE